MASSDVIDIDYKELERLYEKIREFGNGAESVVNDVLHNEGAEAIKDKIKPLIPTSGRKWKGKKKAAKSADSLTNTNENLAVWIKSKRAYNYLYFPDDGTNTRKHVGNQRFMARGAEMAKGEIIDMCISKLVKEF